MLVEVIINIGDKRLVGIDATYVMFLNTIPQGAIPLLILNPGQIQKIFPRIGNVQSVEQIKRI